MKNSRAKGARGERELSNVLKEYGFQTRRGQQYSGSNGDADVVGIPGIYIECKRVEKLNLYDAINQAKSDSSCEDLPYDYDLPAVFHLKNNHEWLVSMPLKYWMELYKKAF